MPYGSTRGPVDPLAFPIADGPLVVVTGATGQGGSHVALALCQAGFRVRATTRSASRAEAMKAKWPGADIDWVVIKDHVEDGMYDEAFQGSEGVFHCAGPFSLKLNGEEMIKANLNGLRNVLTAAAKEPKVRRIIHLSSVAAIFQHDADLTVETEGVVYDETCFQSDEYMAHLRQKGNTLPGYAYNWAKVEGERLIADWRAKNNHAFDVVTLCPCTLYGPVLQAWEKPEDMDAASDRLWHHMEGAKEHIPADRWPVFTNARDLANVAIKSFLFPAAGDQRYVVISGEYTYAKIFSIIARHFPDQAHRFPVLPDNLPRCAGYTVDVSKVERDLNIRHWSSLEESIVPHAKALFALEKATSE